MRLNGGLLSRGTSEYVKNMKKQIRTTEDGWGCVPELLDVVRCIDELGHDIYEIKNCVRMSDLEDMVSNMRDQLSEALNALEDIDTDREYVTDYSLEEE
jgi:hypothetical protein